MEKPMPFESDAPRSDADILFDFAYDMQPNTEKFAQDRSEALASDILRMTGADKTTHDVEEVLKKIIFIFTDPDSHESAPDAIGIFAFFGILNHCADNNHADAIDLAEDIINSFMVSKGETIIDLAGPTWQTLDGNLKLFYTLGYFDGEDLPPEPS